MKTRRACTIFAVISAFTPVLAGEPADTASLNVHEWGTFTTLSGTDGKAVAWYQPQVAELPSFVRGVYLIPNPAPTKPQLAAGAPLFTKSGLGFLSLAPAVVRMETPVLYFYPDRAMPVTVSVHLEDGALTDFFPPPTSQPQGKETQWVGELRPPNDEKALMPSLQGEPGQNYGAARRVPEAWYFHLANVCDQTLTWEKFIFYRGSGNRLPPLSARATGDHSVSIEALTPAKKGWAFALQVEGQKARWKEVTFATTKSDVALDEELPLAEVQTQLAAAVTQKLMAEGLTPSEATAMVNTWKELWFGEQGLRVIGSIPRPWVDATLPLKISPTPRDLRRVFVGRWELLTPHQETTLAALLSSAVPTPTAADIESFHSLHLGRFTQGAWARLLELPNGNKLSVARLQYFEFGPPKTPSPQVKLPPLPPLPRQVNLPSLPPPPAVPVPRAVSQR